MTALTRGCLSFPSSLSPALPLAFAFIAACTNPPPPVLVTTQKDAVFPASPHRDSDSAFVALNLYVSDAMERSVVRGRPMLVNVSAGRGGSRKQPLVLKGDDLHLEVFRAGSDAVEAWPFELLTPRASLDTTVDKTNYIAQAEWILPAAATQAIPAGRYRVEARWGGGTKSLAFEVVDALPVAADDLRSRRNAALDTGHAARSRAQSAEMERAADSMLGELPDDPALLRLKAEALELKGDLKGALVAVSHALEATTPPAGMVASEETDPSGLALRARIIQELRIAAADGGTP